MLRLLRDRFRLRLSAHELTLTPVRAQGVRGRVIDIQAGTGAGWERALDAFDEWLGELLPRRASVDVVIADALVRYAVVPWDGALTNRAEIEALVRIRLAALFGEQVAAWHITLDRSEFEGGIVACAIEPALLERLRNVFQSRRVELRSVAPELMVRYNHWRKELNDGPLMFVHVADGRCQLALRDATGWRSMRSVHLTELAATALMQTIDRELVLQGCEDEVAIYADLADVPQDLPAHVRVLTRSGVSA